MDVKSKKIKFDSSLIFLSVSLLLVLSTVLVYFLVKKFVFNEATGIFVASPTGVITLDITPSGTVSFAPSQTKTISVAINNIPAGKQISAIGFSLKLTGATASNFKINTALDASSQVKQFVQSADRLNFAVATSYTTPFALTNGTVIATFDLTAPATAGSLTNVLTNVTTTALPSVIDSTGVELMKSDTSLLPINITVTTPTLAAPVFNLTTDTVYNSTTSLSVDVPGITGEAIKYCTTATKVVCTPTISVTPGTAFSFTNATPVYLYAQATLSGYASSTSYSPKLTLNDTPTITSMTFTSTKGSTGPIFTNGENITINANGVSDAIGGITSVTFYKDTTVLGTDTTSPYSFTMNNAVIGAYALKAEATDTYGLKASLSTSVTVKPNVVTFSPNGGVSATSFTVTITNPNSSGTIKYSLCDNCAPATTYSAPISVTTSNKITANVTVSGIASDNAVSAQYTVTGKVSAPVFTPTQGSYHPSLLTKLSMATSTSGATIKYCLVSFTKATESTATCTPTLDYTTDVPLTAQTNYKVIAKATKTDWTDSDVVTGIYKVLGDTDTSGKIDITDVLATLQAVFDSTLATPLMDTNKTATGFGDGKIDLFDVLEIIALYFT